MRVGIDLTALTSVHTGVDRYHLELVRHLSRLDSGDAFVVFVNRQDREQLQALVGSGFSVVPISVRGRAARLLAQQLVVPMMARWRRLDVVHSPSFFMPAARAGVRHLLTVFDMTMFSRGECHTRLRRSRWFRAGVAASIRRADTVVVPSRFVRADLLRIMPGVPASSVRAIPLGIGAEFTPEENPGPAGHADSNRQTIGAARPYVLFVGTIEPRKNVEVLIEAYRRMVARACPEVLVLAGQLGWGYHDVLRLAALPELRGRVEFAGHVSPSRLIALYRGASAFVYPSIEEGFGFPPLEAMACGTPTIAADASSLRENLEGAAWLVKPGDVDQLADAITEVTRNPQLRARLRESGLARARGFSWAETARQTLECYRTLSALSPGPARYPSNSPAL